MPEGAHLDSQQRRHDQLFLLIEQVLVNQLFADKAVVDLLDALGTFGINKDAVERVQEVVAGCPLRWPLSREALPTGQDFLDEDRNCSRLALPRLFGKLLPQAIQVCEWIAQSVDVVDAKAVDGRLRG